MRSLGHRPHHALEVGAIRGSLFRVAGLDQIKHHHGVFAEMPMFLERLQVFHHGPL